jgi:cell division ATPase FtsA
MPKARELKHEYGNVTPRSRVSFSSSQEEKVANSIIGVAGQLAGMVQSTINFCRAQSGISDLAIGRVVLSGGSANLTGLAEYLEENLRIPVQRFEPDAGLDISGLGGEDLVTFDEDRGAFACALGLARMNEDDDAFLIDIIPADIKKKRRFMSRTLYMILAAGAAALFLGLLWNQRSGEAEKIAKTRKTTQSASRRAVRTRKKYEEKVEKAERFRDQVSRLGWESRGGTYLMRAQRIVQDSAPESVWIRAIGVAVKSIPKPGEASSKKTNVEKFVVTVDGNIRQLGERVTTTYNKFIESMRSVKAKPVIETTKRPSDAGGEFQFTIDFAGWPGAADKSTEEDES